MTPREVIVQMLSANGFRDGDGESPHFWRCDYPDQNGPCTCASRAVDDILSALADAGYRIVAGSLGEALDELTSGITDSDEEGDYEEVTR